MLPATLRAPQRYFINPWGAGVRLHSVSTRHRGVSSCAFPPFCRRVAEAKPTAPAALTGATVFQADRPGEHGVRGGRYDCLVAPGGWARCRIPDAPLPPPSQGPRFQAGGTQRLSLPTFFAAAKKVGAAPHRGNANRPLTIQGKANTKKPRTKAPRKQKTPHLQASKNCSRAPSQRARCCVTTSGYFSSKTAAASRAGSINH